MPTTFVYEDTPASVATDGAGAGPLTRLATPDEAAAALRRADAGSTVVVAAGDGGWTDALTAVCRAARRAGVASLAVAPPGTDPAVLAEADDWLAAPGAPGELSARLERLRRRRARGQASPDGGLLPMIVHDLRGPLQLLSLSLQSLALAIPRGDPSLDEDLGFLHQSLWRINQMLSLLSDHDRLNRGATGAGAGGGAISVSPRTLAETALKERPEASRGQATLEVDPSCPAEVQLDPWRAALALRLALENADGAAEGAPIRLALRGTPGRLVVDLYVDRPPPASFTPTPLGTDLVERLCGSHAQRRGLDLAVVARVTEEFGGRARLDRDGTTGTVLILEWPVAPPAPAP